MNNGFGHGFDSRQVHYEVLCYTLRPLEKKYCAYGFGEYPSAQHLYQREKHNENKFKGYISFSYILYNTIWNVKG